MNRRQRAAAAARSAEVRELLAQAQSDLDSMGARSTASTSTPAPPADVEAVVQAELDRRARADAEAQERADLEKFGHPAGGGCSLCGLGFLRVATTDGGFVPGWRSDGDGGWHCEACHRDLFETVGATRADRKVAVMLRLLALEHDTPMRALGDPRAFEGIPLWFAEHPGAAPVFDLDERFAHVDRAALRRAWDAVLSPPMPDPDFEMPDVGPCPKCGAFDWRRSLTVEAVWACHACAHQEHWPRPHPVADDVVSGKLYRTDADEIAAQLLGLSSGVPAFGPDPIAGLATRTGFVWAWQTRGGDRHGRRPNAEPWRHLDVAKMRRRAGLEQAVG